MTVGQNTATQTADDAGGIAGTTDIGGIDSLTADAADAVHITGATQPADAVHTAGAVDGAGAFDAAGAVAAGIRAHGVTVGYGETTVLKRLDAVIPDRQITTIIGPNGCGKSTLLRTFARLMRPQQGTVTLDGVDTQHLSARLYARRVGHLPQSPTAPDGVTVADLVARGRHPHQSFLRQWSGDDAGVVNAALRVTAMADLADRPLSQLSGGQRQRAWIAMVLAQETDILLLDEPTTFLDLAHSIEVLDLVSSLRDRYDRTVVMVIHDLNLAFRYADHLIVMRAGDIVRTGSPDDIVTEDLVREVFGMQVAVVDDPVNGGPMVVPHAGARRRARVARASVPARSLEA